MTRFSANDLDAVWGWGRGICRLPAGGRDLRGFCDIESVVLGVVFGERCRGRCELFFPLLS